MDTEGQIFDCFESESICTSRRHRFEAPSDQIEEVSKYLDLSTDESNTHSEKRQDGSEIQEGSVEQPGSVTYMEEEKS